MELKPCPFCGGEAIYLTFTRYYDRDDTVCIFCNRCKSVVTVEWNEAEGINDRTKAKAIDAWNTRAERTCKDATSEEHTQAFTCSECGCWVAYDEYWETGIYVQGDGHAVHIHPHYCPNCGRKVVEE